MFIIFSSFDNLIIFHLQDLLSFWKVRNYIGWSTRQIEDGSSGWWRRKNFNWSWLTFKKKLILCHNFVWKQGRWSRGTNGAISPQFFREFYQLSRKINPKRQKSGNFKCFAPLDFKLPPQFLWHFTAPQKCYKKSFILHWPLLILAVKLPRSDTAVTVSPAVVLINWFCPRFIQGSSERIPFSVGTVVRLIEAVVANKVKNIKIGSQA